MFRKRGMVRHILCPLADRLLCETVMTVNRQCSFCKVMSAERIDEGKISDKNVADESRFLHLPNGLVTGVVTRKYQHSQASDPTSPTANHPSNSSQLTKITKTRTKAVPRRLA